MCPVCRECSQQEEQQCHVQGELGANTDTCQWPTVVWQCFMKGISLFFYLHQKNFFLLSAEETKSSLIATFHIQRQFTFVCHNKFRSTHIYSFYRMHNSYGMLKEVRSHKWLIMLTSTWHFTISIADTSKQQLPVSCKCLKTCLYLPNVGVW